MDSSEDAINWSDGGGKEGCSVENGEAQVHQLAKQFTQQSVDSTNGQNFFTADLKSALNPNGDNFSARAWCKAMLQLQADDEQAHPPRTLGVSFRDLNAIGLVRGLLSQRQRKIDILRNLDGLVEAGETLVVLGPPGSGCSTFLKTISGETHGFYVDNGSQLDYQGASVEHIAHDFRSEAIYTAEVDVHFPKLTVGETLYFAARARAPRHIPGVAIVNAYATHLHDVIMAMFGITHTKNIIVGNDFVRGVSGGERKRVTIAEACLSMAPLQCWDNSTRGLDSANAIEFCKTLRIQADINRKTACVSLYQAPQAAYDCFDKVLVLYKSRQIYFGPTSTNVDFLTSMTSPKERIVRSGYEYSVPNTPDDFAARWKASPERARLVEAIQLHNEKFANGEQLDKFKRPRRAQQARIHRVKSPYTLSYTQQVNLCLWRGYRRLKPDPSVTISSLFGNSIVSLSLGSMFYNLQEDTNSFFQRSALLFFAILVNALGCGLEMLTLYAQRGIVERHARYALYHPSAEAFASMLMDLPEPGPFFFFLFVSFSPTLAMSMVFQSIASITRTFVQALPATAIIISALSMYTGFAIPTEYMRDWTSWIRYINPINFGFESLMVNEYHNHEFRCINYVLSGPGFTNIGPDNQVCSTVGSVPGQPSVLGDNYHEDP
ncbi:P-loop containing nucleoside triphosphate hydrolase protein [Aspergillus venezuelensis]